MYNTNAGLFIKHVEGEIELSGIKFSLFLFSLLNNCFGVCVFLASLACSVGC